MISRRRFLAITAAATAAGPARAQTWRGHALGAEVSVRIDMARDAAPLFGAIEAELRGIEAAFSLYDPASDICRLNATGRLAIPERWRSLLTVIDRLHLGTGGLFDATVQPLWQALARGDDPGPARAAIGWARVRWDGDSIRLGRGQALTLNGIAQGHATDRVRALLRGAGLDRCLVNIGEFAALGGPYRLGLADPIHGHLGQVTLDGTAVANSSPHADRVGGQAHILHAAARPRWSTVSVVAESAALADGLSTALVLAPVAEARRAAQALPGVRAVRLVDEAGDLVTL